MSIAELGAIVGFARDDVEMLRFVLLILSTAARPEAASQFAPQAQWDEARALIDLHPPHWKRTKKHNPILPVLDEMADVLRAWRGSNSARVRSKRTAWRTLRRALDLGDEVEAKTIRDTVATYLRTKRVPSDEIETLLGHRVLKGTSAVYAKYDPDYLAHARGVLATLFREVMAAADVWVAGHVRAKVGNGLTVVLRRASPEAAEYLASRNGEGD